MAIVPNDTRFIGINPTVNLRERRSARINRETQPVSMQDITDSIRPYKVFTALLTQTGGSDAIGVAEGDILEIGVTYLIVNDNGVDLSFFGAPNNLIGTNFICTNTGICPDCALSYNTGAPVATVLENTIGNIWFNYEDTGTYGCQSNDLFTDSKTFVSATPGDANSVSILVTNQSTSVKFISPLNNSLTAFNDGLYNASIEIRVYN